MSSMDASLQRSLEKGAEKVLVGYLLKKNAAWAAKDVVAELAKILAEHEAPVSS